jgi:DNA polymerase
MDARELLRRYLEQRRELGESEFVLDQMTVADAMAALGVRSGMAPPRTNARPDERIAPTPPAPGRSSEPAPEPPAPPAPPEGETTDWRDRRRRRSSPPDRRARASARTRQRRDRRR